jgi:2-hydroxychromene-2-carboxylate isomerase
VKKSLAVLAVTAAAVAAMPAVASAKTLHLFSKPIDQVGGVFDSNGNPLPENQQPPVGSYFVGGDRDYKGTAKHHARGVFGYDHILCTILDLNAHARCNANIVVRNGAIYATNFMLDLEAQTQVITTGLFGTGVYRHVNSITNKNFANGTAELVIRY